MNAIGTIRSPYREKFAIPRQPNLVEAAHGELHLIAPYNTPEMVRGLEQFSHLWLLFVFHQTLTKGWHPTVRPPRLGGNKRIGVLATRSTFRPNPIGLSAVELKSIQINAQQIVLHLGSIDLIDGTPILDIKPYLPYADAHPHAHAGYAQNQPDTHLAVGFSMQAEQQIQSLQLQYPTLKNLIEQVLAQDPRPAYKTQTLIPQDYGIRLYDINIRWRIENQQITVLSLEQIAER